MYIVCDMHYHVPNNRSNEASKQIFTRLSNEFMIGAVGDSLNITIDERGVMGVHINILKGRCDFKESLERVNEYVVLINMLMDKNFSGYSIISSYIYSEFERQPFLVS